MTSKLGFFNFFNMLNSSGDLAPSIVLRSTQWLFNSLGFSQDINDDYIVVDKIGGDQTRLPEPGRCYDFNGTDNFVNLGTDVLYEGTNYLKFSVSIKCTKPLANKAIVSKYDTSGTKRVYTVELTSSGTIQFFISPDGTSTGVEGLVGTADFADDNFHELIFEYNAGTVKTWIDGVLDLNDTVTITSFFAPSPQIRTLFGYKDNAGSQYFDGKLGNLKFYNTSGDIVSFFRADEGNGDVSYDSSGNMNHGDVNGTLNDIHSQDNYFSSSQNDLGYTNYLYYNGTNSYINFGSNSAFNLLENNFSITFSVQFAIYGTNQALLVKSNGGAPSGTDYGFYIYKDSNDKIVFVTRGSNSLTYAATSQTILSGKEIKNIILTGNVTTGDIHIYVNGADTTIVESGTFESVGSISNSLNLRFGSESDGGNYLNGVAYNIGFWNEIKTLTQIDDVDESNLVYYVPSNDNSNIVYDISGNENNAIINNNSWIYLSSDNSDTSIDIFGNQLQYTGKVRYNALISNRSIVEFDNVDDYIEGLCTDCQTFLRNDFTIEMEVRPSDGRPPSNRAFWGVEDTTSTDYAIFRLLTSGAIRFSYYVDATLVEATSTTLFPNAQNTVFTNIKVVVNSTTMTLYINGVQDGSIGDMTTVTIANFETSINPWLGGYNRAGFLFNRIPSAFGYFKMVSGTTLVTEYYFSECYGTKVYDVSGNNHHGTCQNITQSTFWDNYSGSSLYPYNLFKGFEYYDDDATHTDIIRVPYRQDGTLITPTISGYSKISSNVAGDYHNNSESEILQYSSPAMFASDCDSDKSTNYWNIVSTQTPDPVAYSEIEDDVTLSTVPQNQVFADISVDYKYKNQLSYPNALTDPSDLGTLLEWLNSPNIEKLLDSAGNELKVGNETLYVYKA